MSNFDQFNLFEGHLKIQEFDLPGADITLYENMFGLEDSNRFYGSLLKTIKWQQDKIKFYGKIFNVPRLNALYGDTSKVYRYSGITLQPHPWTNDLLEIKNRIETISNVSFNTCLLNYYRDGNDSNDWHQDNEKELGEHPIIASVSFGETRPFQLKHIEHKHKKVDIPLKHGSLLLMKGATQHFWKHKIPKTTKAINPRVNLTFRIIKT